MDLNAPLGLDPPPPRRRLAPLVGGLAGLLFVVGAGLYLLQADPRGGEPFAVSAIPPPPVPPESSTDVTPTGSIDPAKTPAPAPQAESRGESVRIENGVKVVSPATPDRPAPRDSGPLVIDVSKALDGAARKAAPVFGDPRRDTPAPAAPAKPRVAIFVGGLGLNPLATRAAIETMPSAVSLAFVPYGTTLEASVQAAKAKGHELLLQLPMQGGDGTALGPHTLRADEPPAEMADDLTWLMGRFGGYVGVTNLLGAPVTGNQAAMTAILKGVARNGLFYLDDGTSRRSLARSLAASVGVPALQADVVLDATADPAVVRANLDKLAAIARAKGTAVGMASGLSDHLPAIARFAADLDAQGLTLVPVSSIVGGGGSLATTR